MKVVMLVVYVDNIVITRNDGDEINKLKEFLRNEFKMKDLGY